MAAPSTGPAWGTFAALAALVTVALLGLARLSAGAVVADEATDPDRIDGRDAPDPEAMGDRLGPGVLLANVALSQGLFATLLVLAAWYARIPPAALGLDAPPGPAVGLGLAIGAALYVVDEGLARVASAVGVPYSEELRAALVPDSARGWLLVLGVVLPLIAAFEELLFRGVLVGVLAAGFPLPPWALVVGSSALFGFAHGVQGPGGMIVAGALGFGLAAAFVLTGSLVAVIVAHYVVNALELVVHGRLDGSLDDGA